MIELKSKKQSQFAKDVIKGLSQDQKTLSSKYFYDAQGDKIFQQIMAMPEYYLTNSEYEIFSQQRQEISTAIKAWDAPFNLIEFGAGDGYKTKLLLRSLLDVKASFTYYPVDISVHILDELKQQLAIAFPELDVRPLNQDYFQALKSMDTLNSHRNITLFLGSNIGNFPLEQASIFLGQFKKQSKKGDMLLLGVDLRKDPRIITAAYDDPHGITAAFNLNLLERMNRELGATFSLRNFTHHTFYEPLSGEVRSYLVSLENQRVSFGQMDWQVDFEAFEWIHTEISKKYSLNELAQLATTNGFEIIENFKDTKSYFVDSLWKLNETATAL